jgi:type I restriction enzyme M protein
MVKDGSYLIGTCAMITKYDTKMIYQSHLYKIRVAQNNKYNLDKYYLLAILSSDYLKQQIMANTFSHDIINSLGDRLKNLIIPISTDSRKIEKIAKMVKKSIDGSIKARELAKKVRKEIFE